MLLAAAGGARAELQPSQVFIVYNRNLPASGELARYYAAKRHIPARQSIGLDLPRAEQITREGYVEKIRDPLRAWLRREGLQDKIKCIVTMYGVPLKIGEAGALPSERLLVRQIDQEYDAAVRQIWSGSRGLAKLSGATPASQPATRPDGTFDLAKILSSYEKLRNAAIRHLRSVEIVSPGQAREEGQRLEQVLARTEGAVRVLPMLRGNGPAAQKALAQAQANVRQQQEQLRQLIKGCPRNAHRQEAHQLIGQLYGACGLAEHLAQDKRELDGKETNAAVDSELSQLLVG